MKILILRIGLLFLILSTFSVSAATYKNISALGCEALNQFTQGKIAWNGSTLRNTTSGSNLWVVCPISRSQSSNPEDGINGYINYGYVNSASFPSSPLVCVFRESNYLGGVNYVQTMTTSYPGAGVSNDHSFSIPAGSLSSSSFDYWTMSCRLPAKGFIRSFDMTIED